MTLNGAPVRLKAFEVTRYLYEISLIGNSFPLFRA